MNRRSLADYPPLLTVEEYAKIMRIGRNLAYESVRRGDVKAIRIGRRILVPRAAIEAIIGE